LYHFLDELRPHLGDWFILGQRHVRNLGGMADYAGVGVAVDVSLPLPAVRVGMSGADIFGLETLELLLRSELVGLAKRSVRTASWL